MKLIVSSFFYFDDFMKIRLNDFIEITYVVIISILGFLYGNYFKDKNIVDYSIYGGLGG